MKMNYRAIITATLLCLLCVSAYAATVLYGQSLKVGGGFNSVGDGGLEVFTNGDTYSDGKGVFLGGVESYGGFLQAPVELKNDAGQVGLFTGGTDTDKGTVLLNGTVFAIDTSDFESPSGMAGVLSIEDYFGYGERPTLALGDAGGEGLRLHYDLTDKTTADLYDDDADTTLRIENSDGSHVAYLSLEGTLSLDSGANITKGVGDLDITSGQGKVVINTSVTSQRQLEVKGTGWAGDGGGIIADGNLSIGQASGNTDSSINSVGDTNLNAYNESADTTFYFKNTGSGRVADVKAEGDLKAEGNDLDLGDAGGFSGVKFNPATTTLDFYIDGVKVRHFNADGSSTDDVP